MQQKVEQRRMNVLRLIIVDRRIVEAIIFLNRNIIHKILLFKNCFREISIKRMLTIIIPIQKRRIAAVCKAVGVDLIQKEPLFPHSPPAAKADQNDHKKRDRPFFLFYFLHSFCFSSLFLSVLQPNMALLFQYIIFRTQVKTFRVADPAAPSSMHPVRHS